MSYFDPGIYCTWLVYQVQLFNCTLTQIFNYPIIAAAQFIEASRCGLDNLLRIKMDEGR